MCKRSSLHVYGTLSSPKPLVIFCRNVFVKTRAMSPFISPDIVRYVHRKKLEGKTFHEIASEFGHLRQWAHKIYLRFDENGNRKVKAKRGRPRKNDDASELAFVNDFMPSFRTSSAAELASVASSHSLLNPISPTTMRRVFARHKVASVTAANDELTPTHKNRRIAMSSNWLDILKDDPSHFTRVAFSDEVSFDLDATRKTKVSATLPRWARASAPRSTRAQY